MVYTAYLESALIDPNLCRLHTAPQAVNDKSVVIIGCIRGMTVTTLTAMGDQSNGLPLDRVYQAEMDKMRGEGRALVEVGLFADRRKELARNTETLFQLMRFAFYYARWNYTDVVIGVHPRHARFYARSIGFDIIGPTRNYPAVNNRPVTLLRLNIQEKLNLDSPPAGLKYFKNNPVEAEVFQNRCMFLPNRLAGSELGQYLNLCNQDRGVEYSEAG